MSIVLTNYSANLLKDCSGRIVVWATKALNKNTSCIKFLDNRHYCFAQNFTAYFSARNYGLLVSAQSIKE